MDISLRMALRRGKALVGTIITLPSPEIAEILCLAGFDWLFVDLEHGSLDIKDAQLILQTAAHHLHCVIRVPSKNEVWIKKALDIGAAGVIVPLIRTAEEAEASVRLCKYPPEGVRSVGIARAQEYGQLFQEYLSFANEDIAVILQIEHIDAVNNIEKILDVPGIDCLFIGPYDLSASMGKIGLINDPEVQKAIFHVQKSAEAADMPLGIFGANTDAVSPYIQKSYTLIAVGMDTLILGNTAKKITKALKEKMS